MHLVDKNPEQLERASREIQKLRQAWPLAALPGDRSNTAWGTATFAPLDKLEAAVKQSWLTIEVCMATVSIAGHGMPLTGQCVPESRQIKKSVIQQLDDMAPPDVIVASNSSSFTITEILDGLALQAPDRFASVHSCKLRLLSPYISLTTHH